MNALEIKNLKLNIEHNIILNNINFSLEKGKYLTILGPNGAGKSTLIRIIAGLINNYSGEVNLCGSNPNSVNPKLIGYVPQIKTLDRTFPAMAIELAASGINSAWVGKLKKDEKETALYALKEVGIEHLAYKQISTLSGGELQRVYLARSFVRKPQLLLLDEPGTGIDLKAESDMSRVIDNYKLNNDITTIMITHDWNYAFHHSDYVLMLNREQVCFAPPSEAFSDEILRKLFGHIGHNHTMKFGVK